MSVNEKVISHKYQLSHEQTDQKSRKRHTKSNSEFSPIQQTHLHKSEHGKEKFWFQNKTQDENGKENQTRSFVPYSSID